MKKNAIMFNPLVKIDLAFLSFWFHYLHCLIDNLSSFPLSLSRSRLIVPSSCVRRLPSNGTTDQKEIVGGATAATKALGKSPDALTRTDSNKMRRSGSILHLSNKQKRSWWRRALAPRQLQWSEWAIDILPPHCRPTLVFVNVKSGPQVGEALYRRFLRVLHPLQVVCLPRDSPEPALRLFAFIPGVRILCVGGDGTAGWIMSTLDILAEEKEEKRRKKDAEERIEGESAFEDVPQWTPPPVAILPLGTGNDLARCLGWGTGYGAWRQEGTLGALEAVAQASMALFDRWTLTFSSEEEVAGTQIAGSNEGKLKQQGGTGLSGLGGILSPRAFLSKDDGSSGGGGGGTALKNPKSKSSSDPEPVKKAMNNYLGIGVDAKVALEFHEMRESYPQWFQSQFGNRLVYTGVGALDIVSGGQLNLATKVSIECDGEDVPLPLGAEGILIVNIPSYMGGVDLWASGGGPGAVPGVQSMSDGKVEIVAVGGSWHLGQLTVGLSRAVRLRQGRRVIVRTTESLPMQVDGEPFVQAAGVVQVALRGQSRVLRRVENKPLAKVMRAVEEALESAAEDGVINAAQHDALAVQISHSVTAVMIAGG